MDTFYNGMPAGQLADAKWQRSTYSSQNGNCVEVADLPTGEIAMRNSRDPQGSALVYTRAELAAFVSGVKDGEFDMGLPAGDPPHTGSEPPAEKDTPEGKDLGGAAHASTNAQPAPRQAKIGEELENLAERIGAGDGMLDRTSAEQLLRVLGAVASLRDIHQIDNRGNCSSCRTRSWRHLRSVPKGCSVHAALRLYLGRSGPTRGGRARLDRPDSAS
ncbi:MAG: hypothetical protein DLM55_07530 [Acidimicrobiales bacterium]|nr:MAG: hypothetical protein DLM55_07530 [Acidimicrobiales bacterium]